MDILDFDPEVLDQTAETIENYCKIQIELINDYLNKVSSLFSEWTDDRTFGSLIEEVIRLKTNVENLMNEIVSNYPNYFRNKAEFARNRPTI